MPPCLTHKVRIKGKVEQSREGVAPSPTHWCSSYRKGSLRVTLAYGRQLYYVYKVISLSITLIWVPTVALSLSEQVNSSPHSLSLPLSLSLSLSLSVSLSPTPRNLTISNLLPITKGKSRKEYLIISMTFSYRHRFDHLWWCNG